MIAHDIRDVYLLVPGLKSLVCMAIYTYFSYAVLMRTLAAVSEIM